VALTAPGATFESAVGLTEREIFDAWRTKIQGLCAGRRADTPQRSVYHPPMMGAPRGAAAIPGFLVLFLLLGSPAATARDARLGAVLGLGFDWETAEYSPTRGLLGLDVSSPRLGAALFADCGIPWEPSAALSVDILVLDLDWIRLGLDARWWMRAYGDIAVEGGASTGLRVETGFRLVALSIAVGLSARSTRFAAIDDVFEDIVPWARLGVAARPAAPARFELAIASDSALALWLRTSFELTGSWRFASGARIEGLLAARYSDFFTLTGYLDGFEARAIVVVPIGGDGP
jgi:hypothetical protein